MRSELKRTRHCGQLRLDDTGTDVVLNGWIDTIRDHGGVVFANLRDRSGTVQIVVRDQSVLGAGLTVRPEYVLAVKGPVMERPEGTRNPAMPTGDVEVSVNEMTILNPSEVPPFEVSCRSGEEPGEDVRLRFRYLDLRRPRMQRNLTIRHRVSQLCRRYLDQEGFLEIETPFLTRSTPEGARDFLVPCRLSEGQFYALPQSPQLFKQLLMVSGFEKYFQIVRCFRDEDLRADRQPEFTQVDIEMSFVEEADVRNLIDGLFAVIFKEIAGFEMERPVPVMSYEHAMARYGTDRPDLRFEVELVDLAELVSESGIPFLREGAEKGAVVGLAAPEKGALSRKQIEECAAACTGAGAKGVLWLRRGDEKLSGPGAKAFRGGLESALIETLSLRQGDLGFILAGDQPRRIREIAGELRLTLGRELALAPEGAYAVTWVNEFPLFEWDEDTSRWTAVHHPFTSPREEDMGLLEKDPARVRAQAYDIVVNGAELGGGSIRIHRRDVQETVFRAIKIGEAEAQEKFGFLLEGLKYGAPPHGGIALGLDRVIALLAGESSIREVIAFPKTQRGSCVLTRAPGNVDDSQLAELGLVRKKPSGGTP